MRETNYNFLKIKETEGLFVRFYSCNTTGETIKNGNLIKYGKKICDKKKKKKETMSHSYLVSLPTCMNYNWFSVYIEKGDWKKYIDVQMDLIPDSM